ncbi:MAG: peptidoglycan editing factor PgeF [Chitinophagales bacterium]|nr:peptidoglycan editing factor PgeF [Chitinophagales bacterium]
MQTDSSFHSKFEKQFEHLLMLESRRNGGVSTEGYESLNLGLNTQDNLENVHQNRAIFFESIDVAPNQVVGGLQIHEDHILHVEKPGYYSGFDAFITHQKNLFLTIGIADCTPILIYDPITQSVGAAHAGWRGTVKKIGAKTIQKMQENFGTQPKDCFVFIGTCIDACHFEVGDEVAEQFSQQFIYHYPGSTKAHIDLKSANFQQLVDIGVPENQIEISPFYTITDNDKYFSYRKENGLTGRMLAVIGLKNG